jgi:hypothetical protein
MIKEAILTVDFLNKIIFIKNGLEKSNINPELLEKFFSNAINPFWHTEKDQIDFFSYMNTGEYFCQRKKLKYDFATQASYWATYNFKGASPQQAKEFYELCSEFFAVIKEVRSVEIQGAIGEIAGEYVFYEQRYVKKLAEKNAMLSTSDWRMLPDVPESFPGEKDMWSKWRAYLRADSVKKPDDFENALEFFKYTFDIKYPVDPNGYRKLYPGGMLEDGSTPAPEYMDPEDSTQWVKYDSEASSDFVRTRVSNLYQLGGQYKQSHQKVRSSMLKLMKLLEVDTLVDVNWDNYYTEDDADVTFE